MSRLLTAVLVAMLSAPAFAECKADEFQRYVNAAVRLYESLEYERALDQISKAREASCGSDNDATLGLYEGAIRSDLGQAEQSRAAFKEALLLKPDAEIGLKVSPKVKKVIESVRAEAKKELAPILARQEEERKKRAAEEARKVEEARRAEELRKAEEVRRADEARRAEDARRAEEARRAGQTQPNVIVIEKHDPGTDRPENHELTASSSSRPDDVMSAVNTEVKTGKRGVPVVSLVFGGAALVAGGVGAYFGVTSRQTYAKAESPDLFQDERQKYIDQGYTQTLIADVLFGVAGAAAIGAIIALFATPPEPVMEPVK